MNNISFRTLKPWIACASGNDEVRCALAIPSCKTAYRSACRKQITDPVCAPIAPVKSAAIANHGLRLSQPSGDVTLCFSPLPVLRIRTLESSVDFTQTGSH